MCRCAWRRGRTYQLDIPAIEAAITPKTKAILLNTPNNPTGAVYTRESLEHLVMLAESYDFYIISDEIYERLVYGENRHVCVASLSPEAYRRTIVINGLSKTYCMTGWRIGYSAAPLELARGLKDIQGHMTSNSTTFVQYAAIEALNNSEESIREMVAAFEARRQYALQPAVCNGGHCLPRCRRRVLSPAGRELLLRT